MNEPRTQMTWFGATTYTGSSSGGWLCPDLLRYEQIGEADNLRGRIVRGFFWLLRYWPGGPR